VQNAQLKHKNVDILGFPFSISETFQHRNTNKSQEEAFNQVSEILQTYINQKVRFCTFIFRWRSEILTAKCGKWEDVDFWAKRFSEIGIKNHSTF